jgi:hypothetical protein
VKTTCPNCGAPLEFRFDDSFVRVCDHCSSAVLRTDRGLDTLGKVADLVPIESPLQLFAEGHYGKGTFLLVGRAQIRHSAGGIWQEWYAKLGGGTWGWLAEAQGRYYLTFEQKAEHVPAYESLAPGAVVELPVPGRLVLDAFTVAEVTTGTYIAARGELPFKLVPDGAFRYVDLADGHGLFATIDYGEPGDEPTLYVGSQVSLADLKLQGGEVGPSEEPQIKSKRLACPNCNAPVDVRLPGESLRVVCGHCNSVLGIETEAVQVVAQQQSRPAPAIPLGSRGKFLDGELTVIGYLQRSAYVDGDWWPFYEYLLHAPDVGFRWLVDSDGHWSYVQPVAAGAVTSELGAVRYDGVKFRAFQNTDLRVDEVLGEFYWRVAAGEIVHGEDFVAPPAMLSREASAEEETWSLSTYMTPREVKHAFGKDDLPFGSPDGVAPNQVDASSSASHVLSIAFGVLLLTGIIAAAMAPDTLKYAHDVTIPAGAPPAPPPDPTDSTTPPPADTAPNPYVFFSDPFPLDAGHNVQLAFSATLDNNWAYVAADLVNEATGEVVNVDADLEYYSGVDDGDYWSEGSRESNVVVGPVADGTYMLRLESQHGGAGDVSAHVALKQGVFRGKWLGLACLVLAFLWVPLAIHAYMFERKRWDQSNTGTAPKNATWLLVWSLMGPLLLVVLILKLFARSSSNDD